MKAIAVFAPFSVLCCAFAAGGRADAVVAMSASQPSITMADGILQAVPNAKIDGRWLTPTTCSPQESKVSVLSCPIAGEGSLLVEQTDASQWRISFVAARPLVLEALGLQGKVVAFADSSAIFMLSNGYHSWSNSGWVTLPSWPDAKAIAKSLKDNDEARDGTTVSFEFGALSDRTRHLWLGATGASVFKPWVQFGRLADGAISFAAMAGDGGEALTLAAGETYAGDPWLIEAGDDLEASQRSYAAHLSRFTPVDGALAAPRVGWNSWYNQWGQVTATAMLTELPLAREFFATKFRAQGMEPPGITIFLDDGWEKMWGEWLANDKFPMGMASLATGIRQEGGEPGIWIAPFLVDVKSPLGVQHSDWFVKDVVYHHPSGSYKILDVTHPEAAAHLARTIRTLVEAGFGVIKIDFLMTGSMEGQRHEAVTGLQAFHRGMRIIREAAGASTYLLACGAPALASLPYVNAWRIGADIAMGFPTTMIGPSWIDVAAQARNIGARWFYCGVVHCDADPILQRSPHTQNSALTAGWVAALAGGGLYVGDDLRSLAKERKAWLWPQPLLVTALGQAAAVPEPQIPDQVPARMPQPTILKRVLFKNDIHPVTSWRLPDGGRLFLNFEGHGVMHHGKSVPPYTSVIEASTKG